MILCFPAWHNATIMEHLTEKIFTNIDLVQDRNNVVRIEHTAFMIWCVRYTLLTIARQLWLPRMCVCGMVSECVFVYVLASQWVSVCFMAIWACREFKSVCGSWCLCALWATASSELASVYMHGRGGGGISVYVCMNRHRKKKKEKDIPPSFVFIRNDAFI